MSPLNCPIDEYKRIMYDSEYYYALHTFLEDDELHNIWNIVEKAMNRHGFDVSNSELSMRLHWIWWGLYLSTKYNYIQV